MEEELRRQVDLNRAEEMRVVQALRDVVVPVWIDAYGSIAERDGDGMAFEAFIAAVLDALPICGTRPGEA